MKEIIISADGDSIVYLVPDEVANNLEKYCIEFCDKWMRTSPQAEKYRINGVYCYNESDFINYLNEWIFPEESSILVKELDYYDYELPEEYKNYPQFNF